MEKHSLSVSVAESTSASEYRFNWNRRRISQHSIQTSDCRLTSCLFDWLTQDWLTGWHQEEEEEDEGEDEDEDEEEDDDDDEEKEEEEEEKEEEEKEEQEEEQQQQVTTTTTHTSTSTTDYY